MGGNYRALFSHILRRYTVGVAFERRERERERERVPASQPDIQVEIPRMDSTR